MFKSDDKIANILLNKLSILKQFDFVTGLYLDEIGINRDGYLNGKIYITIETSLNHVSAALAKVTTDIEEELSALGYDATIDECPLDDDGTGYVPIILP